MATTVALLLIVPGSLVLMAFGAILSTAAFALVHLASKAGRLAVENTQVQIPRREARASGPSAAEVSVVMPRAFAA